MRQRAANRFRLVVTAAAILSSPAIFFMGAQPCGGASITGTIIDTAADAPLGDAAISVFSYEEDWQTRPDDRGRFAISGLPDGRYSLEAHRIGFKKLVLDDILLSSDESRTLTLKMAGVGLSRSPAV